MNHLRFFLYLTGLTLKKLCQQRWLLAGLVLLCFLLPLLLGPAAETALSRGVDFSGITLAIAAPDGDPVAEQLTQVLSGMQDIRRYCRVVSMPYDRATRALSEGSVSAVLVLPENFLGGVLSGENPDVELLVHGDRPLEALLTLWVGESASGLLRAFQSGIYTVLELYGENPPAGLSYETVMTRINLRYISWAMNRQDLYRIQTVPVTGALPIGLHYTLSLFFYLALSLAPLFAVIFDHRWIAPQRRFRAAGRRAGIFFSASLVSCWLLQSVLIAVFSLSMLKCGFFAVLLPALLCGLFCGAFGAFCCLATADTGSCGLLSFLCTLVFLALSGGILPPVLMPGFLQPLLQLSPVTWLRQMLAIPAGYPLQPAAVICLAGGTLFLLGVCALLYTRRFRKAVADL